MAKIKKGESSSLTNEEKRMLRATKSRAYLNSKASVQDKYSNTGNKRTTLKNTQPKISNPKKYRAGGNNPQSVLKNSQLQNRIGAPSMPPRSGPSAGGSGGGSSMYNRLTGGGLRSHGR